MKSHTTLSYPQSHSKSSMCQPWLQDYTEWNCNKIIVVYRRFNCDWIVECTKPAADQMQRHSVNVEVSLHVLCFHVLDRVPCLFLRDELRTSLPMFLFLHLEPCGNCHTGHKEEKQSIAYFVFLPEASWNTGDLYRRIFCIFCNRS